MTEATRQNIQRRGAATVFPKIRLGSHEFEGPEGWQRLLDPDRRLNPFDENELERQLSAAEDAHVATVRRDTAAAVEDERRTYLRQPIQSGDPEAVEHEAMMRAAAELATRNAGPATYGQIADLIAVTRDVLAELQKRG